jgi:hypothetical protein
MLTECVEVYVVDIPGETRQQVGETKNGPLSRVEEFLVSPRTWLTQRRNLFFAATSPLRRSGM